MRRAQAATAVIAVLLLAGCSPAPDAPTPAPSAPAGTPSGTSTATGPQTLGTPATVVDGLDAPWSLAALPDGGFLVSQRDDGRILEVGPTGSTREAGRVPGVVHVGEGGLNGIVLWTGDGGTWLYAYHATVDDNRVVRMRLTGDAGSYGLSAPQPVVTGIRTASTHNGGRLAFGPDGMLYITTGDAQHSDDAQRRDRLNGKILRVTPEGDPAPGNPFASAVYSYGHRNVQGIAWTPDGTMWATEFGQNTWDELNVIVPGGDYGWPVVEGRAGDARYRDPLLQWPTDQASPSGLAAVGDTLYLACLRGARVWQVRTAGAQVVGDAVAQLTGFGRIRDVAPDGNGGLWVLTNNTDGRGSPHPGDDRVLRVTVDR